MKKLNNKGFMLAEVLAVAVVVMVVFVAIFATYLPATADIENRLSYNDVPSTYAAFYMRKMYLDEGIVVGVDGYKELYNATSGCLEISNNIKKEYCTSLANELGIESMIISTYNTNSLKANYNTGNLSKYVSYLPKYKNSRYNIGNFWQLIPCSGSLCETKNQYRLKKSVTSLIPNDWSGESCGFSSPTCEVKSGFRKDIREIESTYNCGSNICAVMGVVNSTYGISCANSNIGSAYGNENDWNVKCTPIDVYRTSREENLYIDEWEDWKSTSCDTSKSYCQKRNLYRDNQELYRLIIKTKTGYANTELMVIPKDDKIGPLCSFAGPNNKEINSGGTATYTLTCIDFSGIHESNITADDFKIEGNLENPDYYLSVNAVEKEILTSGFKYTITVKASLPSLTGDHLFKISLNSNVLSDVFGNMNDSIESDNIKIIKNSGPVRNGALNNVRYIKNCINGSNENTSNHWVEIKAMKNGENIAKDKTVIGTLASTAKPYAVVIDEITATDQYAGTGAGNQCVTIDLGMTYNLDEVIVWHYWLDGRKYKNNILSVGSTNTSGTASLETIVWNYLGTSGYNETKNGKTFTAWDDIQLGYDFTYEYTGAYEEFTVPKTGYYKVELWGASGASSSLFAGGKGGYTKGTIHLNMDDKIYIYIGGKGKLSTGTTGVAGGYNGGGGAMARGSAYTFGSGGGSTDIRYFNGTNPGSAILASWNDIGGLRSRIMVASGGGGAGQYNSSGSFGGIGGGLIGGSTSTNTQSTGGTQIAGGTGYFGTGSFGIGTGSSASYSCGAGGGYYGGGSNSYEWGAAGGSSYISGYAGVSGVTSSSSTTATYQTNHYSGKYFINPRMETGVNEGDGEAKITYLGTTIPVKTNTKLNNVRYIKSCINGNSINANNNWLEIQAIKDGVNLAKGKTIISTTAQNASYPYTNLVSGNISITSYATSGATGLQCVTVDLSATYDLDEVGLWLYYADGRKYNDNTLSVGATSTSGTTPLSTIMHSYPWTSGYTETSEGIHYSAYKEYEIPKPKTNTKLNSVQYIKSCINGSNINAASHWVEIMAMKDGENIARGKTVTGTTAQNASYPYSNIVDGNTDSSNYGNPVAGTTGLQCVTVDLGAKYDLDGVGLWLYYLDGRKYNDNTLSVGATSTSGTTSLSTIMHSYAGTTGYNETSDGKKYTAWN